MELIKEATFETYFMQAIIKIEKKKSNNTEVYNQVRGIQDVIVVKVINNEQVEALSDNNYDYALLEIKFINEGTPEQTISMIKEKALKIEKFEKKAEKKVVVPKSEPLTKKIIKKIPPCTLFDSSESSALNVSSKVVQDAASPKKNLVKKKIISVKDTLSDNEFLVLVSEFYEALKPLQKKAFERERAGMTPEQFRVYMTPILKRKISKKTI